MEDMTEAELENFILSKNGTAEARYVLGKLMIEGTSSKVPKNENKGLNWLKDSLKLGNIEALEYKTYWEIRFDRAPQLDRIVENLEKVVAANKSARACNTLAELNHASASGATANLDDERKAAALEKAKLAAKYYMTSADQGDVIGTHWMGVFYHEGFGVGKNVQKAVEYLAKAAEAGNGQSMYQLFIIHSGKTGQDPAFKNPEKAYGYLMQAIFNGVTYFDEAI
jgi:TPR repeat protein